MKGRIMNQLKYERILVKISGEALAGECGHGLDFGVLEGVCSQIKKCCEMGCQVAVVVGAGNFWRGRNGNEMEQFRADNMGMMATMMNVLALQDTFLRIGVDARAMSAVPMEKFAETYCREKAVSHLKKGRVVLLGGGTGNPYFTTDTGAVLRAVELGVDVALLAKNIDGVYNADPKKEPSAVKLSTFSYAELLRRDLKVIDAAAAAMCRDNALKVLLFELGDGSNIVKAVSGNDSVGTLLENEE